MTWLLCRWLQSRDFRCWPFIYLFGDLCYFFFYSARPLKKLIVSKKKVGDELTLKAERECHLIENVGSVPGLQISKLQPHGQSESRPTRRKEKEKKLFFFRSPLCTSAAGCFLFLCPVRFYSSLLTFPSSIKMCLRRR